MESGAVGIEQAALLDIVALGYLTVGDLKFVASVLDIVTSFSLIVRTIIDLETLVLLSFVQQRLYFHDSRILFFCLGYYLAFMW